MRNICTNSHLIKCNCHPNESETNRKYFIVPLLLMGWFIIRSLVLIIFMNFRYPFLPSDCANFRVLSEQQKTTHKIGLNTRRMFDEKNAFFLIWYKKDPFSVCEIESTELVSNAFLPDDSQKYAIKIAKWCKKRMNIFHSVFVKETGGRQKSWTESDGKNKFRLSFFGCRVSSAEIVEHLKNGVPMNEWTTLCVWASVSGRRWSCSAFRIDIPWDLRCRK